MPKISIPVDEGWYESDSSPLLNRECKNLYPSVPIARGGSSGGGLFTFPGLEELVDLGIFPESYYVLGDKLYLISLSRLYEVDSANNVRKIGDFPGTTGGEAGIQQIADNGSIIVFLYPKGSGYFFEPATDTITQITDATFAAYQAEADGVESVAYVDGRFVYCTKETVFWGSLSTTNSGKDFDALAFLKPLLRDRNVRVASVRGDLVVFGQDRTKFFATTANQDLPFQEIPQATLDKGLAYRNAFVEFDGSYFFAGGGVDERISIWRGVGGGAVSKVSSDALDRAIQDGLEGNVTISNMAMDKFLLNGNPMVMVKLIGIGAFVDSAYGYSILASSIKGYPTWFRFSITDLASVFANTFLFEFDGRICCLNGTNKLYYLNYNKSSFGYGEDDASKSFSSAYLQNQSNNQVINRLELVMETGTGNDPDTALDNREVLVQMEYSDDGGRTWVNCGAKGAGKHRQYEKRVVWHQLGVSPISRIFRFTTSTDLAVRFHRIDIDLQGGFRNN